jgi:hypothetical protein
MFLCSCDEGEYTSKKEQGETNPVRRQAYVREIHRLGEYDWTRPYEVCIGHDWKSMQKLRTPENGTPSTGVPGTHTPDSVDQPREGA